MAKLTDDAKAYIVCAFARYVTAADIVQGVREEFGVEVNANQLANYNLDGWRARRISEGRKDSLKKWRALFNETREKFKAETLAIPIANASVRLKMLNDMATKAHAKGNFPLAASLLEQAAKEAGGVYTNIRKHEGKVEETHTHVVKSDEEKREQIADEVGKAIARALQAKKAAAGQPTIQ